MSECFWWEKDESEVHSEVFSHVRAVSNAQRDFHEANLCYAQLYSMRREPGLGTGARSQFKLGATQVTDNLIASTINTAGSLIAKSRVKATFLTDGADWEVQQMAKQLEKYVAGVCNSIKIYDKFEELFRDACIFGTGVVKIYADGDKICVDRVLIDNIIVNEDEVPYGGLPRQLHQTSLVSKEVLKARFPEHAEAIDGAGSDTVLFQKYSRLVDPDMALLIESWHLGAGDNKGRHTLCLDNVTLVDEEYSYQHFPFLFYHWSKPVTGFYGQGLAEALLGFQIRVNQLHDFINKCQDLVAVPRVFVDQGSKIMKIQLNNEIGAIIPYVGKPPIFMTPQAVGQEIYRHLDQLRQWALETAGISRMSAYATRPEGIEAAVALRELTDNQSQRFSLQQQRYEELVADAAQQIIELTRSMPSKPKMIFHEKWVEEIDWPEISFEKFRFVMHVSQSSLMSDTPAARKQSVIEFAQYGVPLPPEKLVKLLGHPDLEEFNDFEASAVNEAEWICSELLKGHVVHAEAYQSLETCIKYATATLRNARISGAPESILSNIRDYINEAVNLQTAPQTALAAPEGEMPIGPDGAGRPPITTPDSGLPAGAITNTALPGTALQ